jgi:CHAT domain-containing protein
MTTLGALLPSLVPEERRGWPGRARELSLSMIDQDPAHRPFYLLSAVFAALGMGEPREALRLLDSIPAGSDALIDRRVKACRAWAQGLDRNWYPGDIGGEAPPDWQEGLVTVDGVAPGDAETMLLEACAAAAPYMIRTFRSLVIDAARFTPASLEQILTAGLNSAQMFQNIAAKLQAWTSACWAVAARADLLWRAGRREEARQMLAEVRSVHSANGDAVGVADTWMLEGDRWLTPWSSPEALGFMLAAAGPATAAPQPDEVQARNAYAQAAMALYQADAPRARAALQLRLAFLAGHAGDLATQQADLAMSETACGEAGDSAGLQLTTVHGWLAAIGRGELLAVRALAPLEFAEPHGPLEAIVVWGMTRGSLTFCTGLGRLLQRAAESWAAAGEFDRAELAFRLGAPLVTLNGAVPGWTVPQALAALDERRNLTTRALVRRLIILTSLPPPGAPSADDPSWLQDLQLTLELMSVPAGVTGVGEIGIRLIERGEARVVALMDAAGFPRADTAAVQEDPQRAIAAFKAAWQADVAAKLQGQQPGAATGEPLQAFSAMLTREAFLRARPLAALLRARLAERGGWDSIAEQWYRTALNLAAEAGAPNRWLEILILNASGKSDEARAVLATAVNESLVPANQLATLAVRLKDYATAQELFGASAAGNWRDATDRAEVALETGDRAKALALAMQAITEFEAMIDRLARDADRVSAGDDVSAAALYQVAARIHLRLAQAAQHTDASTLAAERALAFGVADRHRALTLPPDLAGATAQALRQWQQAATEHATAYQRLLAALTLGTGDAAALTKALGEADHALAQLEAALTVEQQSAVARARRGASFTAEETQQLLPTGTCLLEYQVVGRDITLFAITAEDIVGREGRLTKGSFEGLSSRFVRACAAGTPSPDAEELAHLLLVPFAEILEAHERVIVVPSGALNGVPFHVLPFRGQPLGETNVVSYLPAATLLSRGDVDRPLAPGGALVVGDPAFDAATHPSLKRLAGAAVEAEAVAQVHRVKPYVGPQATEAALRPLLRERALLHFAAHGRLDDIAPNTSSIVLAGDDELTVSDLIGLNIGADLAVLSACDTGRGTTTMGGELVGLTRGLLAAGVRRCVVSLWPVDDIAACVTMAAFHLRVEADAAPATALAMAQREIRALTGAELAERYRALGGTVTAGDRAVRRSGAGALRLSAFPEVDVEDIAIEDQDGDRTSLWAPFVLIGA